MILVDGIDIYLDQKPEIFNYACRIYKMADDKIGQLSEEMIKDKLLKYRN